MPTSKRSESPVLVISRSEKGKRHAVIRAGLDTGRDREAGLRRNRRQRRGSAPIAVIGKTEGVCALSREDRFKSLPAIFFPGN